MRVVCVQKPGELVIQDRNPVELDEAEVRISIESVGLCGSDVALLAGTHPYAVYPVVPGHELGGRVLEASGVADLSEGQLVAVRPTMSCGTCSACRAHRPNHCADIHVLGVHLDGGMGEELVVHHDLVYPVKGEMDADRAATVEPTAVAVHAYHRGGLGDGMSLAIIGSGVIGMLVLQIARAKGCSPIFAIDQIPERLEIAKALGADRVLNNREDDAVVRGLEICPDGFDVVMDMVGRAETLAGAMEMARRGGIIVPVALPHGTIEYDFELLYRKELSIVGSRLYNGDFQEALDLIASGDVNPDPLITHRFSLEEAEIAFSTLVDHPDQAIKVLITP
jgi:2-desacetyl-2-hydroxyethyl bacteriochlorophyllide A dehydrogenase